MNLKRGDRGAEVRKLQRKLTAARRALVDTGADAGAANDPGAADGIFGDGVKKSVIWFQNYYELPPDGVAGKGLWLLLLDLAPDAEVVESPGGIKPAEQLNTGDFSGLKKSMARIYNKYGAYLERAAADLGVKVEAAAGVLKVESGGKAYGEDGRMIIRFENHVFRREWLRGVKGPGVVLIEHTFAAHFEVGSFTRRMCAAITFTSLLRRWREHAGSNM